MLTPVEEQFAAKARTPKGRKALHSIFSATRACVAELGLESASLEVIADRAGLTQAALRHYFPTRDELLTTFFVTATAWFQARTSELLADDSLPARDKLERCIGWHFEYMEKVDTAFWLEASAYWLRHADKRRVRDEWYRWLTGQYAGLIGQMQPLISRRERERRAYTILTLVLGAWITHGRGSAVHNHATPGERRQLLLDAALEIAVQ